MKFKYNIKEWIKRNFSIMVKSRKVYYLYSLLFNYSGREHRIKGGKENDNITYYIIRPRKNDIEGLMSIFLYILQRIDYATTKGMIPVVDMKNYYSQYYDGINNVWEIFFSQPGKYSLEEIKDKKNKILSGYSWGKRYDKNICEYKSIEDNILVQRYYNIIQSYTSLSPKIVDKVQREIENIHPDQCIGVYVRGTDYVALKPYGEPVQPDPYDVLQKTIEYSNIYHCREVFLVTEDVNIFNIFSENDDIKLKICSFDSFISDYDGSNYLSRSGSLEKDKIKAAADYLVKILLLSKCKYFVGSITQGSISAFCFNGNKYEDKYIFNLGTYE